MEFRQVSNNKDIKITFDFNNVIAENIGEHGIKLNEIKENQELLQKTHSELCAERDDMAWRALPFNQGEVVADINKTAKMINEKFDNFVVFGIGGSALGSRALFTALKSYKYNALSKPLRNGAKFYVEDNVDPDKINALLNVIDVKKTVFNVITKSGNTAETMSQFIIIIGLLIEKLGNDYKDNIILTTSAKSGTLRKIANDNGFKTFEIPEKLGGRFSVLSPVGLLAAAVLNIDISKILAGAGDMDALCSNEKLEDNPAYMYAFTHYMCMKKGVNVTVMLPYTDALLNTAEWYAQLWAESLSKKYDKFGNTVHVGQTPVRALGVTDQHSQLQLYTEGPFDKIITFIKVKNFKTELVIPDVPIKLYDAEYLKGKTLNTLIDLELDSAEYAVCKSGKMNLKIVLDSLNEYSIGALLYFFEMATAAAGKMLNINAFDQPGVEEGKKALYAFLGREGYEEKAKELAGKDKAFNSFIYNL
ncbi:MAG: glucose-6-phosphate isomerase [Eubacteriales bacterium]